MSESKPLGRHALCAQPFDDVAEFHREMGLTVGDFSKPDVTVDTRMRLSLILEEVAELAQAVGFNEAAFDIGCVKERLDDWRLDPKERRGPVDPVAAADALVDTQYVINGAGVTWGLHLPMMHAEVHRSNMTKKGGTRRADGKLLKPPHYEPPDLDKILKLQVKVGALLNSNVGKGDK